MQVHITKTKHQVRGTGQRGFKVTNEKDDATPMMDRIENVVTKAYTERAQLLSFLTTIHDSVIAYNDPDDPLWPVLYVNAHMAGQMTWHIAPNDLHLFKHVPVIENDDPRATWDGHDTDEKYKRLQHLVSMSLDIHASVQIVLDTIQGDGLAAIKIEGVYKFDDDEIDETKETEENE